MSKVKCAFCDSIFEYTGQTSCPCCGASLSSNEDVQRILDTRNQVAGMADRILDNFENQVQNTRKMEKFVKIFILIVFIIIFLSVLFSFFGTFLRMRFFFH